MATAERDIHELAVSAEENLSDLTTGLAQEGADPDVIETVRKMASVMRKIVRALGPGAGEPPQEPAPQAQSGEAQQPAGPPQTLDAATNHLHSAMQAAAAARQGGR